MTLLNENIQKSSVEVYLKIKVDNIYNHKNKMKTESISELQSGKHGLDAVVYTEDMEKNINKIMEDRLNITENQKDEYIQKAIKKTSDKFNLSDLRFHKLEIDGNSIYAGDNVGYIIHSYDIYVVFSSSKEDVTIKDRYYLTPKNHKKRVRQYIFRDKLVSQNKRFTFDELNDRVFIEIE